MFKILILILAFGAGFAYAQGYRLHVGNVPYYLDFKMTDDRQELLLRNGKTVRGTVEAEDDQSIKINLHGAAMVFKKSEIAKQQTISPEGFLEQVKANYETHHKIHPLVTQSKEKTMAVKVDQMIMEPSRIADEIRQKNPDVTSSGKMQEAMVQAKKAQTLAQAQEARVQAELNRLHEGY